MSSKLEAIKAVVERLSTNGECCGIVVDKQALAELRNLVAAPDLVDQGHVVAEVVDYVVQNPHQRLWYGPELGRLPVGTRLYLHPGEQPDVVELKKNLADANALIESAERSIKNHRSALTSAQGRNAELTELLNGLIRRVGIKGISQITRCEYTHPKADIEELIRSGFALRELAEELGVSIKPTESVSGA